MRQLAYFQHLLFYERFAALGDLPSVEIEANPLPGVMTQLPGIDLGDRVGEALVVADIEGDRYEDIMAGAIFSYSRLNARMSAGEAYIVQGKNIFFGMPVRTLDQPDPDTTAVSTYFGVEVAGVSDISQRVATGFAACDLNGDGIKDFVMGAAGADGLIDGVEKQDCGEIYVYWSKTLLRNADVTQISPYVDPPLSTILPLDPSGDLYKTRFKSGYFDPDKDQEFIVGDASRPLVFYQIYDSPQDCNTLKLHKHQFPEIGGTEAFAVITF
jgi:hypothetical protein